MRILGIDPGTTRVGWGLIEKGGGLKMIDCGLINGEDIPKEERLSHIDKELRKLFKATSPDLVCVEKLFFSKNKKTASAVSEARGVILLATRNAGLRLLEFSPSEIKSTVAGDGRTNKQGVKRAVEMTLKTRSIPGPDDISDALAIAIRGSFERDI